MKHSRALQARVCKLTEHSRNIQEQAASIKAAHSQEIEGIHHHYNQQMSQLDRHIKQLSMHAPVSIFRMPHMPHDEVLPLPPRGYVSQQHQLAQLQLPPMQGQKLLQYQQDDQNPLPIGCHSSEPDVQPSQSDRWFWPLLSPLILQTGQPIQQHMPTSPSNSKDSYGNLDITTDKSQNIGIIGTGIGLNANDVDQRDGSIPFDPSNLPEPV